MLSEEKSFHFGTRLAVVLIALLSFSLMLWASFGDSAIMDELAHIPAGYGYVHNLDYRLNPEHPPLVKALAAVPLLFLNLHFPTGDPAWTTAVNGQWDMGTRFLYESGNDANLIVRASRVAPILLTILLIFLIYLWSAELIGRRWALLPALLFGLSPTVLAHGHYVTTDIGAALGVVAATYFFLKFLKSPSRTHLFYAGAAFGAAQLMKFSTVLLVPYFLLLIALFWLASVVRDWSGTDARIRLKRFLIRAFRHLRSVVIIFAIGYFIVVYPVYFLFTFQYPIQKQITDTQTTLTSFSGGPTPPGHFCKGARCLADLDVWMSKHEVTRPFAEYLLGVLMVLQRADGGNTSYFLGQVSSTGSRYYFPAVYALKESLPTLAIVFTALALGIAAFFRRIRNRGLAAVRYFFVDYLNLNFEEFSMGMFVIFYWIYSMKSPLNIGFRHLIPTIPFIYILSAGAWKRWVMDRTFIELRWKFLLRNMKSLLARSLKFTLLCALVIWFFAETIFAAPHFLSYFNEIGDGTMGGYRFVTDSNYDWGQDILRLKNFVASHPEIDKIAVDYFGGGSPKYYLAHLPSPAAQAAGGQGSKEVDWRSSKGNPADQNIHWLAVSVNTLQGATQPPAPGQTRDPDDGYEWLISLRKPAPGMGGVPTPDFRAGTSIFIYKL